MLDELIEYKEYTDKQFLRDTLEFNRGKGGKSTRNIRLKYDNLGNSLSGIERPLCIIAKYFWGKYNDETITINALYSWCGSEFDHSLCEEANELEGYLKTDLVSYYTEYEKDHWCDGNDQSKKKMDNIAKLSRSIENKISRKIGFKEDTINKKAIAENADINTKNKTSIPAIVMNAKGRQLNRRVLVCRNDIVEKLKAPEKKKGTLSEKEKDYLRKLIAYSLMFGKKNTKRVFIKLCDVYNWSLNKNESNGWKKFVFENGECPIHIESLNKEESGKDEKFISLDDCLKENYRVVNYTDIQEEILYGETVFVDRGAKEVMKKFDIANGNDIMRLLQELGVCS